jgi:hypothetical protein
VNCKVSTRVVRLENVTVVPLAVPNVAVPVGSMSRDQLPAVFQSPVFGATQVEFSGKAASGTRQRPASGINTLVRRILFPLKSGEEVRLASKENGGVRVTLVEESTLLHEDRTEKITENTFFGLPRIGTNRGKRIPHIWKQFTYMEDILHKSFYGNICEISKKLAR